MLEYAEHQFGLHKPRKGGTLFESLKQVEKQTGRKLQELKGPELPFLMRHVWSVFLVLSNNRTMGMNSSNPITFEAIKAYCDLTETKLSPREVDTIRLVDQVYRKVMD